MSNTITCPRCSGEGYISKYAHIQGGLCFKCQGSGEIPRPEQKKRKAAPKTAPTGPKTERQVVLIGVNGNNEPAKFGKDVVWFRGEASKNPSYFKVSGFDQGQVTLHTPKSRVVLVYDETNNCWRGEVEGIKLRVTRSKIKGKLTYWAAGKAPDKAPKQAARQQKKAPSNSMVQPPPRLSM